MNGKSPALGAKTFVAAGRVDVLVVDGNSSDGTGQIADELARNTRRFMSCTSGKKTGWAAPTLPASSGLEQNYEFIFEMDCDFSHNPDDVPAFLDAAKNQNADLVLGSRYSGGVRVVNWPLKRLMLSAARAFTSGSSPGCRSPTQRALQMLPPPRAASRQSR